MAGDLKANLDELDTFREQGWDSYGAAPVSTAAIEEARRILVRFAEGPMPTRMLPESGGFVELEWETCIGPDSTETFVCITITGNGAGERHAIALLPGLVQVMASEGTEASDGD